MVYKLSAQKVVTFCKVWIVALKTLLCGIFSLLHLMFSSECSDVSYSYVINMHDLWFIQEKDKSKKLRHQEIMTLLVYWKTIFNNFIQFNFSLTKYVYFHYYYYYHQSIIYRSLLTWSLLVERENKSCVSNISCEN